jgi:hypothetical protein
VERGWRSSSSRVPIWLIAPAFEHRNALAEQQRFARRVCHVKRRDRESRQQLSQLAAHLTTRRRVERGERLVE